jgi:hypothetical protein
VSGVFYHSPARIVQAYLIEQNVGIDPDGFTPVYDTGTSGPDEPTGDMVNGMWPVFTSYYPDEPDDIVVLYNTQGRDFGYTQVDSEREEMEGIQVLVRGVNPEYTYLKAHTIALLLDHVTRHFLTLPLSDTTGTGPSECIYEIASIARTTNVIAIGRDAPTGKREEYTMNAIVTIRLCSS